MPFKTMLRKKDVEQQLMLKIRMELLLMQAGVPAMFHESLNQRIETGVKALEDRINIHGPSQWFKDMFTTSMAYYGDFCWYARSTNKGYQIEILESLPEHKKVAAK